MMLGIDSNLHVVADDAGTAAAGRHRTAVGIGQRDLLVGRGKHLLLVDSSLPISSFSFVTFSVSLVTFAASASVGSANKLVLECPFPPAPQIRILVKGLEEM